MLRLVNQDEEATKMTKIPLDCPVALLRLGDVLAIINVSRSTWWAGIKSGRFPKPIKLGPRTSRWDSRDIYALVETGVAR